MAKPLALQQIRSLLAPGMRVLLHAGPSESPVFLQQLQAEPELAQGITFTGLFVPGINAFDYTRLTPTTRMESLFAAPALRGGFEAGRLDLLPLHYSAYPAYLRHRPADLAILHLPPAADGRFSCGLAADIAENVRAFARKVAVLVNPRMPATHGGVSLSAQDADAVFDAEGPLLLPSSDTVDPAFETLAGHVAGLIADGDTLQFGIGRLPAALLRSLTDRRRLRIHSGMIIDEVAMLVEAGALAMPIITGIALGGAPVRELATRKDVLFHGVDTTHDIRRLATLERFTAINSAIEVDLFGQINSEFIRGRPVSGIGGSGDFMRAARLSPGGRSIIALLSQARGVSRIVPCLPPGAVSHPRSDIDILVTEHGHASLRELGLDARAEAIIALAAPDHRSALAESWRALRANL